MCSYIFVVLFISVQVFESHAEVKTGRGTTTDKVLLLDNYIPAAMQVIFYLTDSMKYEIKPSSSTGTTTTLRPTPPHKPGNYAPEIPPGPSAYFAKSSLRSSWAPSSGNSDTDTPSAPEDFPFRDLPEDLDLLGAGPSDLLHQINSLGDFDTIGDEDDEVLRFSINYEDNVNVDFLRQKKIPPTRAYVTLLSLYDLLNKEAKEKGLNKYNGYHDRILHELSDTSDGSAEDQLKFVLNKVLEARNTRKANIIKKIKTLLEDLAKPDSYLNESLRYIPPLQFSI